MLYWGHCVTQVKRHPGIIPHLLHILQMSCSRTGHHGTLAQVEQSRTAILNSGHVVPRGALAHLKGVTDSYVRVVSLFAHSPRLSLFDGGRWNLRSVKKERLRMANLEHTLGP